MVVGLAVRLPLVVVEAAAIERLPAVAADEALGVPLRVEGGDVVLGDGPVAAATLGGKQLEVVLLAVGLAVLLVEAPLAKLLATLGAEEVLRVPGLVQGRHAFVEDGPVAVSAAGREDVVVVCLAVGLIVPLKEVLGAQLLVAVGTREVLGVPCAPQGRHHLSDDGLVAGRAVALGGGVHPLLGEVGLQGAQHGIQLVGSVALGHHPVRLGVCRIAHGRGRALELLQLLGLDRRLGPLAVQQASSAVG